MGDTKVVEGKEIAKDLPSALPEDPPAKATTTSEEQAHSASQRKVNLIWEFTQAFIAVSVVITVLFISVKISLAVLVPEVTEKIAGFGNTAFTLMSSLASLVIGFYFGRTNHQNVGGTQLGR